MLKRTAEYALRIAIAMASRPEQALTGRQIAQQTRIPPRYLYRVLQALGRADLVRSHSGPGGGYLLQRDPDQVSLLQVVRAIEPLERIRSCPVGLKTHTRLCPLHRHLDAACAAMEESLSHVMLGHILRDRSPIRPLAEKKGASSLPGKPAATG